MSLLEQALAAPHWTRLGWVLVHFLWQGALVALLAAAFLRALRESDARERYAVGCLALLALAVLPPATWIWLAGATHDAHAAGQVRPGSSVAGPAQGAGLALIAWSWVLGAVLLQLRLLAAYRRANALARRDSEPVDARWQDVLTELAQRLGLRRPVGLRLSSRVSVPALIGWLEPVVLVPVGALTALSAAEVRAVLAHELAHLRRLDPVINVLQGWIEALLFFHPAVWWISRRVREEREFCCDDLAAALCGDPLTLAQALTSLESSRATASALVLSSRGGPLMQRIRRLVNPGASASRRASLAAPALFAALTLGLTAGPALGWSAWTQDVCEHCGAPKSSPREGQWVERLIWERRPVAGQDVEFEWVEADGSIGAAEDAVEDATRTWVVDLAAAQDDWDSVDWTEAVRGDTETWVVDSWAEAVRGDADEWVVDPARAEGADTGTWVHDWTEAVQGDTTWIEATDWPTIEGLEAEFEWVEQVPAERDVWVVDTVGEWTEFTPRPGSFDLRAVDAWTEFEWTPREARAQEWRASSQPSAAEAQRLKREIERLRGKLEELERELDELIPARTPAEDPPPDVSREAAPIARFLDTVFLGF